MARRTRSTPPVVPPSPPPTPAPWRLDLAAGILLLLGLLLTVVILSHDPADPPGDTVYPLNEQPTNLLGEPGAWLAHTLFEGLGWTVYILLACWFVLVVLLLLRRSWLRWGLRLTGWLLLLPFTATLLDGLPAQLEGEAPLWIPRTGAGGSIGAWLAHELQSQFDPLVQAGVLIGVGILCAMLAFDFVLRWVARVLWRGVSRSLRREPRAATARAETPIPVRRLEATPPAQDRKEEDTPDAPVPEVPPTAITATPRTIPIRHHDVRTDPGPGEHGGARHTSARAAEEDFADYELPPLTLLEDADPFPHDEHDRILRERASLLEKTFADFGLRVQVVGINTGPVITQFEIALEKGLSVRKVTRLADDIALNLRVPSVRMVAPIPGKDTVGVETPNDHRAIVRIKEVLHAAGKKLEQYKIPLFLGKDAEGRPLIQDLAAMPHLLIAGSTGTGKSVCMNAIILSMLLTRRPDEVKMIMVDPKVVELSDYSKIPHLMHPVVTDMKKAEAILAWAVDKMEERYDLLSRARVRNIAGYNDLSHEEILRRVQPEEDERERIPERMPYIVIFLDEVADLILQFRKEVEGHIIRLSQKSRAAGIHLVLATQKPTVDVITGLIKSNLPSRICFRVVNKSDSRVVLDEMGADKLLGKGDMLFLPPGTSTLVRGQCTYASDDEIERIVTHLECEEPCYAEELMHLPLAGQSGNLLETVRQRDELYEAAIEIVVREQRGSVSLLQRVLGIGYGRAARLVDYMAEDGIVGEYNGSNAREVLFKPEQWEQLKQASAPR